MKLIVDIPEEVKQEFDKTESIALKGAYFDLDGIIGKAIQNGIPLDDVKAEIDQSPDLNPDYPMDKTIHISKWNVMQILDNIGNAESIDPNDMTCMFEDAFKGWHTDELLEQLRKKNNDNPEDTGCDHND